MMAKEANAPHRKGVPLRTMEIPKPRSNGQDVVATGNRTPGGHSEGVSNGDQANTQPHDSHSGKENADIGRLARSFTSSHGLKNPSASGPTLHPLQKQQLSTSPAALPSHHEPLQSPIDPLSHQILKRTNTEKSASKLRPQLSPDTEGAASEIRRSLAHDDHSMTSRVDSHVGQQKVSKDKKKGTSFLSRFIGNKKRDTVSESNDDVSELGEQRAAGMDAEVFAQPIGFIPRFPPPPKYIKVRALHRKNKDFDRLFVAQELKGTPERPRSSIDNSSSSNVIETEPQEPEGKAIWALKFSKDGKFLAAAGQDWKVRVWAVIASPEDRQAHEIEEEARNDQPLIRLSAPVFKSQPVQEFEGHTASVVDLSWSKNNFLLSTSMDKTVRLWHVTRNECLCIFKHSDFVTSIEFHPRDDRFFLAGSLDHKLRLWSIPDKSVAFWATLPDMITAVAFTPDGKHSIAGCLNGLCLVFDTDGLKVQSQIHVRSARGKNAKGSKITGIDTILHPPGSENAIVKLLVTSNDSRIRLYNFRDRTLEAKFRGNENATSQIHATFSSDGRYVICGSEDRRVYIWPLTSVPRDADKRPVEVFEAHPSVVTTAVFAPVSTKQVLGSTGDLLYDLCNPPPVTLAGQAPSISSKPTEDGKSRHDEPVTPTLRSSAVVNQQKAEEPPNYLSRSSHPNGNIIVTADYNGCIKVFRQDCGYHKRPRELWDGNNSFTRRLRGRANSVSTRRSIASSIGKTPSDRILSWRSGVIGNQSNNSFDNLRNSLVSRTRSVSPNKSIRRQRSGAQKLDVPKVSVASAAPSPQGHASSRNSKVHVNPLSGVAHPGDRMQEAGSPADSQTSDPLWLEGDHSYVFWDKNQFTAQATRPRRPSLSEPNTADLESRKLSVHSAMTTSDVSSRGGEGDDSDEDEELSCSHCGGTNFRATRTKQGGQKLICAKCGSAPA
ncbi:hypothetical protein VTO42DRAFT_1580 [Malbranchea cinnamomea]